ncbi:MAG: translation elongation factor Ts [Bacteroidota bacterium]
MEITSSLVKQLRDRTGAGMMECKNALVSADGDIEKAIENLRKKGAAIASKRADRIANQGLIVTKVNAGATKAVTIEINCETDFVARNEDFISFGNLLAEILMVSNPENVEKFLEMNLPNGKKISEELNDLIAKIGEKLEVKRFKIISTETGVIDAYTHLGSKIGVLVELTGKLSPSTKTLVRDLALQVAAMSPIVVNREEVAKEKIETELDVYRQLAKNEGKPEAIAEKIAQGRLEKFYQEVVLLEQSFIKDASKNIKEVLAETGKILAEELKIARFIRYQLGEQS